MEFVGFAHFTVDTFTGKEWGYGDESETVFNPSAFDANQIVSVARKVGMKELILTCKHHDGFCLWPSKFTEPFSQTQPVARGHVVDVFREISHACRDQGPEIWNLPFTVGPQFPALRDSRLRQLLPQPTYRTPYRLRPHFEI